jgi:hypothetical protein
MTFNYLYKSSIKQVLSTMRLFPLMIYIMFLVVAIIAFPSCNKTKEYEKVVWEDRPSGKECIPRNNATIDFENPNEFFDKDHLYCIAIEMEADAFERMRNESRFGPSVQEQRGVAARKAAFEYFYQCDVAFPSYYNWYSADIEIDGAKAERIGLRKKGFFGSIYSIAPSIKIDVNRYAGQTDQLGALQKMTLNNNSEDPSRMMQALLYRFYEWANYPSPQCNLANVGINGEALGIYSHVEPIEDAFLLRAFGNNTGSLYECQLTDFRMNWVNRWESKTNATDRSKRQIAQIAYVLDQASDEDLVAELETYINIDNFIRFWALEIISNHVDGYCRNSNNAYVYFDPSDGNRATFIPSGVNYFQKEEHQRRPLKDFTTAELPRRLSRCPGIPQRLESEIHRLLDQVWDEQALSQLINHFQSQVYSSQHNSNDVNGAAQHYVPALRNWIGNRKATLKAILAVEGIPTGNSNPSNICYFEE